jgi:putative ABC transport system permease protein
MTSFRVACRSLARRAGFTFIAILTLAVGIAATTTVFSVVDTVLLKALPFPNPERLVTVMEANPARSQSVSLIAPGRLEDWSRSATTFTALSASYTESVTDTAGAEPERLDGRRVAPRYFDVFVMAPLAGRAFTADEERAGGPNAAIVSESFWTRRFGRDRSAIGARLVLGGTGYSIVGVMPRAFSSAAIDVWLPAQTAPGLMSVRAARFMSGVGRLKAGVTIEQAVADLKGVQQALGEQYPATDRGWSVTVGDLKELRVGEYRRALTLVFGAVALLLAIAMANIAGLMLVQLRRRRRELSIRQAIGGSRGHIVTSLMQEVAIIAAAGAAAGGAAAYWLVALFARVFATVPRMSELALDWRALAFSAATSGVAALVFGLWPAMHATRGNLAPQLAEGGRGGSPIHHRLQHVLVAGQIALTVLLIGSAGLMLRSYYNLGHVDTGLRAEQVVTFHVGAAWNEDRIPVGQMQERLLAELARAPGVTAVGFVNFLPATGGTLRYQIALDGRSTTEDNGRISVGSRTMSSDYLRTLGVPLLSGSWCPPSRFDFKAQPKAIVNRAFAERYGPDLIGRHFTFDQTSQPMEIVGVAGNTIEDGPSAVATPYVYACLSPGSWPDPEYVVRLGGNVGDASSSIRAIVRQVAPGRAIFGMRPLEQALAASLDQPRLNASALTIFGGAAMTLASLGLYSLLTLLVSERARELGVRLALGATARQIVGLVLGGAARLMAGGIAAGLILTLGVARVLRSVLFGVDPLDLLTLTAAVALLIVFALAAAALPARRAAAIDPIETLRAE